jgi:hypothetical protein
MFGIWALAGFRAKAGEATAVRLLQAKLRNKRDKRNGQVNAIVMLAVVKYFTPFCVYRTVPYDSELRRTEYGIV